MPYTKPPRTCTMCGQTYPAGGYRAHRNASVHRSRRDQKRVDRDNAIVAELLADPYATLQSVADRYGITRERVRQIYQRETGKQSTRRRELGRFMVCKVCGERYLYGTYQTHMTAADHPFSGKHAHDIGEMVRLYEDGLSSVQVGRIYGLHATSVCTMLRRAGVTLRPRTQKGGHLIRAKHVYGD